MLPYEEVFKSLNKARIKYVVAGGVAVVLHGYPRYTADLDLMVYLKEKNLGRFFDALKAVNFMPKVPVSKDDFMNAEMRQRWKKEKNMIVFSFQNYQPPFRLIDMFIDEPIVFDQVLHKAVRVRYGTTSMHVMSIEHLIELKNAAGRGKDLEDVVQLRAIKERIDEESRKRYKKTRKA